jgi:hypothetical protein
LEQEKGMAAPVRIGDDRVEVGEWSADLGEVIAAAMEIRGLLRQGRAEDARRALQARPTEAQAALVALDENPEEVLALTGMGADRVPAYCREVVDHLPSAVVAELVVPGTDLLRFNTQLLAVMSPETLGRTVDDTLDPVYYHGYRSRVSWEWLEAIVALDNVTRIAELLSRVDESVLEDALIDRMDNFDLEANVALPGCEPVAAYRLVSQAASGVALPPLRDPADRDILVALHQAAPGLLARVLRAAWERSGEGEL